MLLSLLRREGDLSHTSILYYCIKWMYFLGYNDFQKWFSTLISNNPPSFQGKETYHKVLSQKIYKANLR
jgi:hypothetical protein